MSVGNVQEYSQVKLKYLHICAYLVPMKYKIIGQVWLPKVDKVIIQPLQGIGSETHSSQCGKDH